jgi:hypothetical protein
MKFRDFFILIFIFYLFSYTNGYTQVNFLGKPGLVRIPKPSFIDKRDNLQFQLSYLPKDYAINNFMNRKSDEFFYSVQLRPLSWLSVNFVLTRPTDIPRIGIGDRHLDFQFFILNQKKYGVNLSAILSPALAASFIDHNSIFISRSIAISNSWSFEPVFGYGLKDNFRKPPQKSKYENMGYQWISKSEFGNNYLSGFFAGVQIKVKNIFFLSAEYDTQYINLGTSFTILKKIGVHVNYLDLKVITGQVSYKVYLDKSLKRNMNVYE